MSKQNTATKILAAIIGTPGVSDKQAINPVSYSKADEFDFYCNQVGNMASDFVSDSAKTHAGNCFCSFEDGSILVFWDWRMAIGAFESVEKAVDWVGGDDPRRLYSDFGVFA